MLHFMKNTRASLIDFAANTKCKKEKVNKVIWPFCSIANFFLIILVWFTYFIIVLLTIPFSIVYSPTEGFKKLGRSNGRGYFFDSYSSYLKYHQASIGAAVAIIIVIATKVILTFY